MPFVAPPSRPFWSCCLLATAGALTVPSAKLGDRVTRRSMLATGFTALAPALLAAEPALAETCFGKCPEDPSKIEERRAIQTGSQAAPLTLNALIEKSIKQREDLVGMSLSEEEKKQLEAKVRAAYPGVK